MIFLTILPSKCKEKYFLRIFSCAPDILKTAFFIERKRVTMQNQEHPKESGKNLGFYAASGICLLTLVAAIGVGISGLGKESAKEAQVSVGEETEPAGAATSDLTVSEEEDENNAAWLAEKCALTLTGEHKLWPHRVRGEAHFAAKDGIFSVDVVLPLPKQSS